MSETFDSLVAEALAEAESAKGWDFSFLDGRRHEEAPPWSYRELVLSRLASYESMLDLDTGGGEDLRRLHDAAGEHWPRRVEAAEPFAPNLPVARRTLAPIGVDVRLYSEAGELPFPSSSFELIINRHGQYDCRELRRLLRPGGLFITEQVGDGECQGLNRMLAAPAGTPTRRSWDLKGARAELEAAGFRLLEAREHRGRDLFDDIGAVVWYLTKVPWQLPDFSVEAYRERLLALHERIEQSGPINAGSHHFLLIAY